MSINTSSVSKQVYDLIRSDILSRKLKPGDKIDTQGIAEANGVSAMPVRSALQQLAVNGLVVARERVGYFVRDYSREDIIQILCIRKMFETYCLSNFFDAIDRGAIASLLDLLNSTDNRATLELLDSKIHSTIVYSSHNRFLIEEYDRMSALFSIGIFGGDVSNTLIAKEEHRQILIHILAGEKELSHKALVDHLERSQREILSQL